jgi:MFS family permease
MADRFGTRRSLVASLVAAAGSLALLGAASAPAVLWPACLLAGVGIDLCRPIVLAAADGLTARRDRARAQSLMFWGSSVGFAVGSLCAGALASAGFGWLFVLDAMTCAVFAVVVWAHLPDGRGVVAKGRCGWGQVLFDRVCVAFVGLQMLASVAMFQLGTIGALTLHDAGITTALYGVVLAATAATVAIAQPLANPWLLARDPSTALVGAAVLTAAGCALAAVAATPLEVAPAVAALAAGQVVTFAVSPGVVAGLGARQPGRYQGLAGASYSLAFLIAPLLGGVLLATASASAAWLCSAALCLAVAVGQGALAPALRARLA